MNNDDEALETLLKAPRTQQCTAEEVSAAHSVAFNVCAEGGDERSKLASADGRECRRGKEGEGGEEGRRKYLTAPKLDKSPKQITPFPISSAQSGQH